VTIEIQRVELRRTDVTVPSEEEVRAGRLRAARCAEVKLKVTAITLAWLVSVAMLLGWGLANKGRDDVTNATAALVAIVLPFVSAVIATRNRMPLLGGVYVVVTLLMVFPALGIVQGG
jgi:hypothetical protein